MRRAWFVRLLLFVGGAYGFVTGTDAADGACGVGVKCGAFALAAVLTEERPFRTGESST